VIQLTRRALLGVAALALSGGLPAALVEVAHKVRAGFGAGAYGSGAYGP
jgi:hypothetical protein